MGAIVVVGLGPGGAGLLTREAEHWLGSGRPIWLRTRVHPTVAALPGAAGWRDFDTLYEQASDFDALYAAIVDALLDAAEAETGPIVYAVPGHPTIGESTVARLRAAAPARDVTVKIVAGVSFLDVIAVHLPIDPLSDSLQIVDGLELAAILDREPFGGGLLPISPLRPALVGQIYNAATASAVKLALGRLYPDEHPITIFRASGVADDAVTRTVPLHQLDHSEAGEADHLTSIFLPALPPERAVRAAQGLQAIMARLRAPDGCPWDHEQTHQSIRANLLEETYEALDALDSGDMHSFCEELGDVLLQVHFQAQMAEEAGEFTLEDVFAAISSKLVRRHPHVFGDVTVSGSGEVLRNWDQIKAEERKASGAQAKKSALAGIPRSMPGLARAALLQERAERLAPAALRRQGSEFSAALAGPLAALRGGEPLPPERLGALLFGLVGLARGQGRDAEEALGGALAAFGDRFMALERQLAESGRAWQDATADEVAGLWDDGSART